MHRCNAGISGHFLVIAFATIIVLGICGCSSDNQLMPTPNLYAWGKFDPYKDVPAELQNNHVNVLYFTDRVQEGKPGDPLKYGFKRSRSSAFGVADIEIGRNVPWKKLTDASRTQKRHVDLTLHLDKIVELGRFQATPPRLVEVPSATTGPSAKELSSPEEEKAAEDKFQQELSKRLAATPCKEVYIFVHGFANSFYDSVSTTAELWHFLGHRGVPVAYTWPAGSTGLFGYMYDRESSEFTVYHLKQMLRMIAANEDVEKINIISHSRGTDVASSAIRELNLEIRGSGKSTRQELKLGVLVLAAPDLDFDVVIQRLAAERVGRVPEQCAIYVCSNDKALGMADWLFSSVSRLGQLNSHAFSPEELHVMRRTKVAQIIDARVSKLGQFGHSYFHDSPAVSSDLILMIRYHLQPGEDFGRPLRITKNGFWTIDDEYPGPPRHPSKDTTSE
jgi:esterase/lipase superfamily enzyme